MPRSRHRTPLTPPSASSLSLPRHLAGVNVYAAAFLIPIGVMFYTAQGGLKATFIASWAHVAIIYIAL